MKRQVLLILLLASLVLNAGFLIQSWRSHIVVSVPDGDSLQLRDGRRVRLLGLDAPEKGRCMSNQARELLSSVAKNKHVRLKDTVTDDYGRVLADVFVRGVSVNRQMLSSGFARSTGGAYKAEADAAKAKKLGIYSAECRSDIPSGDCTIKGNIREGKPVYYLPVCKYYDQVIVDESFGDAWFCTEKEARTAGFTNAPSCQ